MNKVILTGRLTKDIELKQTKNGKIKTSFDLAVKSNYRDKEGNFPTLFIPCTAFSKLAEYMHKYMEKGQLIEITGHVYSTRNNDTFFTNIIVESTNGLEAPKSKKNNVNRNTNNQTMDSFNEYSPEMFMNPDVMGDEMPF